MGAGAFLEPLVVISLLAGGTFMNRQASGLTTAAWNSPRPCSPIPAKRKGLAHPATSDIELGNSRKSGEIPLSPSSSSDLGRLSDDSGSTTLLDALDGRVDPESLGAHRRHRTLRLWKWACIVATPNTEIFQDRLFSRLLQRLPFLVEAWYWALIYWVYQLGRAFTALLIIDESVVDAARRHALRLIHLEQRLHVFIELPFQQYFLAHPTLLHWINRIYSYIHIPGTILFLIVLYYITTAQPARQHLCTQMNIALPHKWNRRDSSSTATSTPSSLANPALYESRRRTMAMCNLIAFIVFTAWPCMPPRLLNAQENIGKTNDAIEAASYGFVDTVHGAGGESSVWTSNRFCNQYAAMPSLHFGYSFLIGLTIATLPLASAGRCRWKHLAIVLGAMAYPTTILIAIIATANHFVLDAVAGACVCILAWYSNHFLLNLLPLEDYFLWAIRVHKPAKGTPSQPHGGIHI